MAQEISQVLDQTAELLRFLPISPADEQCSLCGLMYKTFEVYQNMDNTSTFTPQGLHGAVGNIDIYTVISEEVYY